MDRRLLAALTGAVAATIGDLALLWVAWAHDGRLGVAQPPAGMLLAGHYLGVLGIPLYALGYRALADGIAAARPAAARWVMTLGAIGSVVGAVVHGLTGVLIAGAVRTGAATAPDAMLALPEAAFLLPLWGIVATALAVGSLVFAAAVVPGGTSLPRWLGIVNPFVVTLTIAMLATPIPSLAAFAVPVAPNLAHVVVFAAALHVRSRS